MNGRGAGRQRSPAGAAAAAMGSCEKCGCDFPSRNKLFKHIKQGCGAGADAETAGAGAGTGSAVSTELQLAQLVAKLAAEQGGVLEAARVGVLLSTYHTELLKRYQRERVGLESFDADDSWLATCAAAHPELITLERVQELQVRCNDEQLALAAAASAAADAGRSALVNPEASAAAGERLKEKVCRKASGDKFVCKEKTPEGWIGVPYIVRGAEQRLASYTLLAPRADLARAADPGRFCLSSASEEQLARRNFRRRKGGVSWAVLTAHFRVFAMAEAEAAEPLWEWREDLNAEGEAYAEGSCFAASLRLTAAGEARALTAAAEAGATTHRRGPFGLVAGGTMPGHRQPPKTPKQEEPAAVEGIDPLALEPGTPLLLVAGQAPRGRIGSAVALELRLCASYHGVSEARLRQLSPGGLWALLPPSGPSDAAFLDAVGSLAAVRRAPLRLLCASSDATRAAAAAADGAAAYAAVSGDQQLRSWSLETESLYPENVAARLPYMYTRPDSVFNYAISLSSRLGASGCQHDPEDPGRRRLVAIEALSDLGKKEYGKNGERNAEGSDAAGRLLLGEEAEGKRSLWEASWWRRWQQRTHNFDGALDLHLAAAACNVARFLVLERKRRNGSSSEAGAGSMSLLDPCAGTGTLAAAAVGCGGWDRVVMTEIRQEWATKTRENLDACSPLVDWDLDGAGAPPVAEVYTHDATLPFSALAVRFLY